MGLSRNLRRRHDRFGVYQAADLGRAAYEALLKWLLDILEQFPNGLAADQLARDAVDALDLGKTSWPKTWRKLVSDLPKAENPLSEEEATAEFTLTEELLEAGTGEERAPLRSRRCIEKRTFLAATLGGDHPEAIGRSLPNELAFLDNQGDARDYTFLVETEDGRMRLRAKDGPVLTNPRLRPALTFLRDIHLIDDNGLTKRGERLAEAA